MHFDLSRRKAGEVIKSGKVRVNKKVVLEPWFVLKKGDIVEFQNKCKKFTCKEIKKVYYLFHKPLNVISAMDDHRGRATIKDVIKGKIRERVFHVGRLDYNTSGLMILTNDGDFANLLMHPRYKIEKKYEILIKGRISEKAIKKLKEGVNIGDYVTQPAKIEKIEYFPDKTKIIIVIKEGKKRQIRRMFKSLSYEVIQLKRLKIGPWSIKEVPKPGDVKEISKEEIERFLSKLKKGLSQ